MANWILAVDESGNVNDQSDHALLGGVLVREHDTSLFRSELRRAIEAALPGVPWPPHATELRFVSARPTYAARGVPRAAVCATEAARHWGLGANASTDRAALTALSARPLPWRLRQALQDQVHAGFESVARVAEALGDGEGTAWVVAAWEDVGAGTAGVARYQRLLDAVAERVELCLARQPRAGGAVEHNVLFHSSEFGVARQWVTERHLGRVGAVHGGVRWTPTAPQSAKDAAVHPLLIMADFVCNQLRSVVGNPVKPRVTWGDFATRATTRTGLSPECDAQALACPLPAVAALGLPQEALRQRTALPNLSRHEPAWAREQAQLWLGAL
ncbi:MAG: hypothetical protein H6716_24080 [Polyangiaceae bacterium]|nr:hypothetical protein [Polyangiaceae bacterium]